MKNKLCPKCKSDNVPQATRCQECGVKFTEDDTVTNFCLMYILIFVGIVLLAFGGCMVYIWADFASAAPRINAFSLIGIGIVVFGAILIWQANKLSRGK